MAGAGCRPGHRAQSAQGDARVRAQWRVPVGRSAGDGLDARRGAQADERLCGDVSAQPESGHVLIVPHAVHRHQHAGGALCQLRQHLPGAREETEAAGAAIQGR
eukprot:ctg_341.g120